MWINVVRVYYRRMPALNDLWTATAVTERSLSVQRMANAKACLTHVERISNTGPWITTGVSDESLVVRSILNGKEV